MIIAFANQKGGVGKTTSCVNLAAALARKNKFTLLIDADPQGNASSGLGYDKNSLEATLYDGIINDVPLMDLVITTERKNLSLIPSNIDLAGAEIELVDREERQLVFKKALDKLRDRYDYVLIDCPPSVNLITLNALTAADALIVPIQTEYYALEGVTQLIDTLKSVQQNWNPDLSILGVLLTMYDSRTQLSKQVADEVRKFFGDKVFKSVIPRNVRLSEAPSYGQTIFEYEKWSRGAGAYEDLAKEVIKRTKEA